GITTGVFFGSALAADGDTLVVGSSRDSQSGRGVNPERDPERDLAQSGAAYVFRERDGRWEREALIKAENPGASDAFGFSVALEGDTLLIGAPLEGGSQPLPYADGPALRAGTDDRAFAAGAVY